MEPLVQRCGGDCHDRGTLVNRASRASRRPIAAQRPKQVDLRARDPRVALGQRRLGIGEGPLGVEQFATHRLPLSSAPEAYETFQKKQDGAIKILLQP